MPLCDSEFVLECILFPTYQILSLLRTIGWAQSARYGEQEERVLARIISKIKEFILYYGFTKAILQRCENEEFGAVLARECGRNRTL